MVVHQGLEEFQSSVEFQKGGKVVVEAHHGIEELNSPSVVVVHQGLDEFQSDVEFQKGGGLVVVHQGEVLFHVEFQKGGGVVDNHQGTEEFHEGEAVPNGLPFPPNPFPKGFSLLFPKPFPKGFSLLLPNPFPNGFPLLFPNPFPKGFPLLLPNPFPKGFPLLLPNPFPKGFPFPGLNPSPWTKPGGGSLGRSSFLATFSSILSTFLLVKAKSTTSVTSSNCIIISFASMSASCGMFL